MLKRTIFFTSIATVFLMVAGTAHMATGDGPERGMVMVVSGGGFLQDAEFVSGVPGNANFSFFAGYDKKGNLKGSLYFQRVYPAAGVRALKSTEITDIQTGTDGSGTWVMMTGTGDFMPSWSNQHVPDHTFTLIAWDLDGTGEDIDMVWIEIRRPEPNGTVRPAVSLLEPTELTGGNVLIFE